LSDIFITVVCFVRNTIFENPPHTSRGKYDVIVSMETRGGGRLCQWRHYLQFSACSG